LQQYLIQNPEAGEVVPGSGGVRKVRWARPGAGKRGGLRIIYFVRYRPNEFWMLTLYSKARREKFPRTSSSSWWRRFDVGKKLTGKALAKFEAERDVWQEVLDGVREIKGAGEGARRSKPSLRWPACG
jgi:hypothetical protein